MRSCVVAVLMLAALLAGCSTVRHSEPQRTATEQLLISTAADRAAERLTIGLEPGTKVYVDDDTFKAYDQEYALGAIRNRILQSGGALVGLRSDSDVVVEARAGALSLDKSETLVGIPSMKIPVPLAGPLEIPEVALFKRELERGVAKFAITAYDRQSGRLLSSSGPEYGFSHRRKWVVLLLLSWTTDDFLPPDVDERDYLDVDPFH